jgi:hypothetical protein
MYLHTTHNDMPTHTQNENKGSSSSKQKLAYPYFLGYPTYVLRCLVFKIHQCYHLSWQYIAHCQVYSRHSTRQGSTVIKWSRKTYNEYCDILLTPSTFNSWAGTAAWEYALLYPSWFHPGANVFQQLEQHLHKIGSVTSTAHVTASHPQTVWTPGNEDVITAAVAWELSSSQHITQELGTGTRSTRVSQ